MLSLTLYEALVKVAPAPTEEACMTSELLLFGDPHGDFRSARRAAAGIDPADASACIFLGDFDLEVPLEQELAPLLQRGCEIYHIYGNHEADRESWYDNLFSSSLADGTLHGRVVEIGGVRVAGLGGVFKGRIWHPNDGDGSPKYRSREDFMRVNARNAWRGGLPLGLRATIFPEDYDRLADLQADILVTHEAPSCHRYGFKEIDLLAEAVGARLVVHGHHHEPYAGELSGGIEVIGMGLADVLKIDLARYLPSTAMRA
jgi:predicted phosphodiesterase